LTSPGARRVALTTRLSVLDVGIDVVRLRAEILGGTTRPLRSERLLFRDRLLAAGARGALVRLGGLPLCSEVVRTRLLARAGRFLRWYATSMLVR
jgi:hypothetical protein